MSTTAVKRDQRYGTVSAEPEGSTVTVWRHGAHVNLITYEAHNPMAHNAVTVEGPAAVELGAMIAGAGIDATLWAEGNR